MRIKRLCFAVACLVAIASPSPILAQQNDPSVQPAQNDNTIGSERTRPERRPPDPNRLTIGFGGGIGPSYEGSDDFDFQPGGLFQGALGGFEFAARGTNLFVDLVRDAPRSKISISAGPVVQLNLNRNGSVKDPRIAVLGERSTTLELGGYLGISKRGFLIPPASISTEVSVVKGVSGAHRSVIISPSIGISSPLSKQMFARLGISADYAGRGYGRAYFDVDGPGSLASGLAPYAVRKGAFKSVGTTLLLARDLGGDALTGLSVFGLTGYKRLLGQFRDSPIVRDAGSVNQVFGVVGVAYSF
jgi:outer membrane scaffolding protein for murein synthesis (MipA/OmpV family)